MPLSGAARGSARFHGKELKNGLEVPDLLIFKKQPDIQFLVFFKWESWDLLKCWQLI